MRILLDTNIVIHRETDRIMNPTIGQLFRWLDQLQYTKCVHPLTLEEIRKHAIPEVVRTMGVKLESYHLLMTTAPLHKSVQALSAGMDKDDNDRTDSFLLNELVQDRVDHLITEDRKIHRKAASLGFADKVSTISHFVEACIADHPDLVNYKVLSVQKTYFGTLNVSQPFFDSFREDYPDFNHWFNGKSDYIAYVCYWKEKLVGFLYLKVEWQSENYQNINPGFAPKKRLKIGTFKVVLNGYRIGERFLKIVFDNALVNKVDEIYVTIFDKTPEQLRLIELLEEWGFVFHGEKNTTAGTEKVYTRDFSPKADRSAPKSTFPFIAQGATPFFVPIWPDYHTELLPDSILNTESPANFRENEPHRNALSKVYISHSWERGLKPGDAILFYRTGGKYAGVATTIGIVEKVHINIQDIKTLMEICWKKTFFTEEKLREFWNRYKDIKPFVVEFLYAYSLQKRPNLARLVELGILPDIMSVPRGFSAISMEQLRTVLTESQSDERLVVN